MIDSIDHIIRKNEDGSFRKDKRVNPFVRIRFNTDIIEFEESLCILPESIKDNFYRWTIGGVSNMLRADRFPWYMRHYLMMFMYFEAKNKTEILEFIDNIEDIETHLGRS